MKTPTYGIPKGLIVPVDLLDTQFYLFCSAEVQRCLGLYMALSKALYGLIYDQTQTDTEPCMTNIRHLFLLTRALIKDNNFLPWKHFHV